MKKPRFLINLKDAHEKSGLTAYAVAKQINSNSPRDKPVITESTVRKYATQVVETTELISHVIVLAEFYGVDWHDPAIVQVIEEDESEGQLMAPLIVPA